MVILSFFFKFTVSSTCTRKWTCDDGPDGVHLGNVKLYCFCCCLFLGGGALGHPKVYINLVRFCGKKLCYSNVLQYIHNSLNLHSWHSHALCPCMLMLAKVCMGFILEIGLEGPE